MMERFGIAEALKLPGPVVRVVVASVEGSTPRDAGAAMFVTEAPSPGAVAPPSPARREGLKVKSSRLARPLPEGERLSFTVKVHDGERAECDSIPGKGVYGTIGGGQLEFEAIAHARSMLEAASTEPVPWRREMRVWPLGPSLGQCCGGSVRILFELYTDHERAEISDAQDAWLILRPTSPGEPLRFIHRRQDIDGLPLQVARVAKDMLSGARQRQTAYISARKGQSGFFIEPVRSAAKPLYIYGAGHVGRAIVRTLADIPFAVHWVDVHTDRFPPQIPDGVRRIVAADPAAIASAAPQGAYHLVLTYSHALDLAICHALLANPAFSFLGLIGSASKRARFIKRLREGGVTQAGIDRLTCPIGIGNLRGKEPATIAISVAAQLIERLEQERATGIIDEEGGRDEAGRISA
jgi:xanthine dehydrogenase accessory factor